ncbi:ArnT family glycosyltransferase [Effusibacillus dendaii]|uniref:4-amino-4-deoxy-L-arabinose transferase n=1 Tax=Effusibacillus dendaii TaxID=2743772 RepID=A0A7I8DFW6_9BACL|nr:glycosyltransferase family 39 protein [Effusibacillus dendaii]BCJ87756.1 4-amino-4-deoxy-L-arabinose transferase [Effusibacillus dendaii]
MPKHRMWIGTVLLIALLLRLSALAIYGLDHLSLHSDDVGYTNGAIRLLETGMLTYKGPTEPAHFATEPTVKIMPGQPLLLAAVFLLFGSGTLGMYAAKIVMIGIGLLGIYGIYLLGRYIWGTAVGVIAAFLLAVSIEHIVTDNLLLTETPFFASLVFLVYFSVRLARERKPVHFYSLLLCYMAALMFKTTVALYPVLLLIYLLLQKYPFRLLMKQAAIAAAVMLMVLSPWWIRNYVHYHTFIPLTAGEGNPLLLGSYQGKGYPNRPPQDELMKNLKAEYANVTSFEFQKIQAEVAKQRIKLWWETDRNSFIESYAWLKPKILWKDSFYWVEIFHIKEADVHAAQWRIVKFGLLAFLLSFLLNRKGRKELFLLFSLLGYFTVVYSVYFVFGRYNEPLMPFLYLAIGVALVSIWQSLRTGLAFWRQSRSDT